VVDRADPLVIWQPPAVAALSRLFVIVTLLTCCAFAIAHGTGYGNIHAMSDDASTPPNDPYYPPDDTPGGEGNVPPPRGESDGLVTQGVRHSQIAARVPESVAGGVFSTGAIVLQGPQEFLVDFVVALRRPHQVAARVVLSPPVFAQVITALRDNIEKYQQKFGELRRYKRPPGAKPPTIQEIYEELKLPDEKLAGAYANGVIVGHSPSEFSLDFLANFYPRAAVSCRIYISANQAPSLLETLQRSYRQYQQRTNQDKSRPQPPTPDQLDDTSSDDSPDDREDPPADPT